VAELEVGRRIDRAAYLRPADDDGQFAAAARQLGIHRTTLRKRLSDKLILASNNDEVIVTFGATEGAPVTP
jgi:hypothetical protein